ncbi:MAG: SPOR domain-containing protein [Magnetococcales bacterium]|nr:SPOR domain-containing protein [Magnetococcales bacterium]
MFENKRQRRKWALVLAASLGLGLLPGCASQLEESPVYYVDARSSQINDSYTATPASAAVEKLRPKTVVPPSARASRMAGQTEVGGLPMTPPPLPAKRPAARVSEQAEVSSPPSPAKSREKVAGGSQQKKAPAMEAALQKPAGLKENTSGIFGAKSDENAPVLPGDQRYYIDLGSFQDQESVSQIASRLTDLGLPMERKAIRVGERTFLRLTAGPFPFRAEAEWAAALLKEKTGMEGTIVM